MLRSHVCSYFRSSCSNYSKRNEVTFKEKVPKTLLCHAANVTDQVGYQGRSEGGGRFKKCLNLKKHKGSNLRFFKEKEARFFFVNVRISPNFRILNGHIKKTNYFGNTNYLIYIFDGEYTNRLHSNLISFYKRLSGSNINSENVVSSLPPRPLPLIKRTIRICPLLSYI